MRFLGIFPFLFFFLSLPAIAVSPQDVSSPNASDDGVTTGYASIDDVSALHAPATTASALNVLDHDGDDGKGEDGVFPEMTWEQFLQEWVTEDDDTEEGAVDEVLLQLHEQPINVNGASVEMLSDLPFLSAVQCAAICRYVQRYGPMQSLKELLLIRELDHRTCSFLPLFLTVGSNELKEKGGALKEKGGALKEKGGALKEKSGKQKEKGGVRLRQEVAADAGVPLYLRRGYKVAVNGDGSRTEPRYGHGIPVSYALRYRGVGSGWSLAVTAEKDEGEAAFADGNGPFDSYSFSFSLERRGCLQRLVVGDFHAHFGRGLSVGGSTMGRQALAMSRSVRRNGISASTGTNEVNPLRGVAAHMVFGDWTLMAFAAARKVDGRIADDDGNDGVQSLLTSGTHRLPLERERKHNLGVVSGGVDVMRRLGSRWHVGFDAVGVHYGVPWVHGERDYQAWGMEGRNFASAGMHYDYVYSNLRFGGEFSSDAEGHPAMVHELHGRVGSSWNLTGQYRYYANRYHAPLARGCGGISGMLRGEQGALLGFDRPGRRWALSGYVDYAWHPVPIWQADRPSTDLRWMGEVSHSATKRMTLSLRYTLRDRERNAEGVSFLRHEYKHTLRLQGDWNMERWCLIPTVSACLVQPVSGKTEEGCMASLRSIYKMGKVKLQLWGAWFHTDSWQTALSAYQPSSYYVHRTSMLYLHGVAAAVMADVRMGRHLTLTGGINGRYYTNCDHTGSADRMIDSPSQWDANVELRYVF